jgi:hypothetical protein
MNAKTAFSFALKQAVKNDHSKMFFKSMDNFSISEGQPLFHIGKILGDDWVQPVLFNPKSSVFTQQIGEEPRELIPPFVITVILRIPIVHKGELLHVDSEASVIVLAEEPKFSEIIPGDVLWV